MDIETGVAGMADEVLVREVAAVVGRSNRLTARLLVYLAEVERRGVHLKEGCSSLFSYCVERLGMAEGAAYKRVWAARVGRRFPLVLAMIARGEIHLTGVHLLARHLTEENHAELLGRAAGRTKRDIERLVAELAPRPARRRRSARPTFRGRSGAPCGRAMAGAVRTWAPEAVAAPRAVFSSCIIASPGHAAATIRSRTSSCGAGRTTSSRRSWTTAGASWRPGGRRAGPASRRVAGPVAGAVTSAAGWALACGPGQEDCMMKRLIGGAALAAALALGGTAAAEPERAGAARRDRGVTEAPAKKTAAKRPAARQRPVKSFNFDGDAIDGERNRPDGTTVFGLQGVRHPSLIRVRADFLREIARAAERID